MSNRFPLETIRHSASHVLAQAVQVLFPDAVLAIGPATDEGFYYDFDLPRALTPDDLQALEREMQRIIGEQQTFKRWDENRFSSEKLMQEKSQAYKLEIIRDLNLNEYSFYQNGPFVDLCRGPHVDHTGQIGAIKLLKVSGAYWRGNEKNKMLQRIYGTAFPSQAELETYLHRLEEAQKRDHRVLGKELELFSVQEDIGPGLILWHPKGARVRYLIEEYWRKAHFKAGYELLYTPHIGRENLWQTSGHLDFYKDNMFAAMEIDENPYFVKPMNCPFHIMIYKARMWSYRDLPLRMAELGTVYRFERSGVLHGLMRVRGFTQDDAHIFCSAEQMQSELHNVISLCVNVLKTFGFEKFKVFLSTRPEKFVGEIGEWEKAEAGLKEAIEKAGLPYEVDVGGGAFYGPKIDLKIEDAIGREWQCSTVQFDFNLPERFDLSYTGPDGKKHRPYMIHRALLGSIERFFGVLIEHYAGKFPVWLAPVQVRVLAVNDAVLDYANSVVTDLRDAGFRVELDASPEKLGYKIRSAQTAKIPFMLVIGNREKESQQVAVRSRDAGDLGAMSVAALQNKLSEK